MLRCLARQLHLGERNLGSLEVRFGVAGRRYPSGDLAASTFGLPDTLLGVVQPLLSGKYFDEAGCGSAGLVDPRRIGLVLLLADLGPAKGLSGCTLAAEFDHPADAQCGFG